MEFITEIFGFLHRIQTWTQIAGLAGLGLALASIIFGRMIASNVLAGLSEKARERILALWIIAVTAISLAAIFQWKQPSETTITFGPPASRPTYSTPPTSNIPPPERKVAPWQPTQSEDRERQAQGPTSCGSVESPTQCVVTIKTTGDAPPIKMTVGEINLGGGSKARLRATYLWLDAEAYSLLASGYPGDLLKRVVGQAPALIPNETHQAFIDLLRRFGTRIDEYSRFNGRDLLVGNSDTLGDSEFDAGIPNGGSALVLADFHPIEFPDVGAMETLLNTPDWPSNYQIQLKSWSETGTTPKESNWARERHDFIHPPLLRKNLILSDYENFAPKMQEYLQAFAGAKAEGTSKYIGLLKIGPNNERYLGDLPIKQRARALNNTPIFGEVERQRRFFSYIARDGWPKGLSQAVAYTDINYHDNYTGSTGWQVLTTPPAVRVQVLMLEVIGARGSLIPAKAIALGRADKRALRSTKEAEGEFSNYEYAVRADLFSDRQKVLIPTAIEVRRGVVYRNGLFSDYQWLPNYLVDQTTPAEQAQLRSQLDRTHRLGEVSLLVGGKVFHKSVWQLLRPQPDLPHDDFVYGPRTQPRSLILTSGQEIPIRQFDPNTVVLVAGFATGSCPYLYVKRDKFREPVKIGRVLVNRMSDTDQSVETVRIGSDVREITIVEEEAEVTYLRRATLLGRRKTDRKFSVVAEARNRVLTFGQSLKLSVPRPSAYSDFRVELVGHFTLYRNLKGGLLASDTDSGNAEKTIE